MPPCRVMKLLPSGMIPIAQPYGRPCGQCCDHMCGSATVRVYPHARWCSRVEGYHPSGLRIPTRPYKCNALSQPHGCQMWGSGSVFPRSEARATYRCWNPHEPLARQLASTRPWLYTSMARWRPVRAVTASALTHTSGELRGILAGARIHESVCSGGHDQWMGTHARAVRCSAPLVRRRLSLSFPVQKRHTYDRRALKPAAGVVARYDGLSVNGGARLLMVVCVVRMCPRSHSVAGTSRMNCHRVAYGGSCDPNYQASAPFSRAIPHH